MVRKKSTPRRLVDRESNSISNFIEVVVEEVLKDVQATPNVRSILKSLAESTLKQVEEEAAKLASYQGREFATKRDLMLASRMLGITSSSSSSSLKIWE